jgi:hypothetical protein
MMSSQDGLSCACDEVNDELDADSASDLDEKNHSYSDSQSVVRSENRSQGNSVSTVTRLWAGGLGFDS